RRACSSRHRGCSGFDQRANVLDAPSGNSLAECTRRLRVTARAYSGIPGRLANRDECENLAQSQIPGLWKMQFVFELRKGLDDRSRSFHLIVLLGHCWPDDPEHYACIAV